MFTPVQILNASNLGAAEKLTLLALNQRIGKNLSAVIPLSTLVRDTSTSYKTALKNVNSLAAKGWIKIDKSGREAHTYRLAEDKFSAPETTHVKGDRL